MRHRAVSRPTHHDPRTARAQAVAAVVAFLALVFTTSATVPAHAAEPPPAGQYEGGSDAYTGAQVTFAVDESGTITGFETESYCTTSFGTLPVQWSGMPPTSVQAGVPFDVSWVGAPGDVQAYYELTGVVGADGQASGTGRAGFLPFGTCGGSTFSWTATLGGDGGGPGPGPGPADPALRAEPSVLRHVELEVIGTAFEGVGLAPDSDARLTITRDYDNRLLRERDVRTDSQGVAFLYYRDDLPSRHNGEAYTVELTGTRDGAPITLQTSLVVYNDSNAAVMVTSHDNSVSPGQLTVDEVASSGVRMTAPGFPAGVTPTLYVDGRVVGDLPTTVGGGLDTTYVGALGAGEHELMVLASVPEGHNDVPHRHASIHTFTVTGAP